MDAADRDVLLAELEAEAERQPSPPPREPWWVLEARRELLRSDWLMPRWAGSRTRGARGRFVKEQDR